MSKTNRLRIIVGMVLIITSICLALYRKKSGTGGIVFGISRLPIFRFDDNRGLSINSAIFSGKPTYVQFVDSDNPEGIAFASTICSDEHISEINIILVIEGRGEENKLEAIRGKKNIIVTEDTLIFKRAFKNRDTKNRFYIFRKNKRFYYSGKSTPRNECGAKIALLQLARGIKPTIAALVPLRENIGRLKWFGLLLPLLEEETPYLVVSMFSRICDSCSGGQIIRELNSLAEYHNNKAKFVAIINSTYGISNLNNLISAGIFSYPVIIADDSLGPKWNSLISLYCEDFFSEIMFVVSREGDILRVASKGCNNCYSETFRFIRKALSEGTSYEKK